MSTALRIAPHVLHELVSQTDRWAPEECCGLLAGASNGVELSIPLSNVAEDPSRAYFAEPRQLVEALRGLREQGKRLLGIYHSHPQGPLTPSPTDVAQAFHPDCAYVIIGPPDARPRVRAFRIIEGRATPLDVETFGRG